MDERSAKSETWFGTQKKHKETTCWRNGPTCNLAVPSEWLLESARKLSRSQVLFFQDGFTTFNLGTLWTWLKRTFLSCLVGIKRNLWVHAFNANWWGSSFSFDAARPRWKQARERDLQPDGCLSQIEAGKVPLNNLLVYWTLIGIFFFEFRYLSRMRCDGMPDLIQDKGET